MESTNDRVVTCMVDGGTYAIPALTVREVVRWLPVTRVPHGGAAMSGVINLRGAIVPLIDLRTLLGLAAVTPGDRTCVIVVTTVRGGVTQQAGLIVDAALEVIRLQAEDAEAAAHAGPYVAGIARVRGGIVLRLDCNAVVAAALGAEAATA